MDFLRVDVNQCTRDGLCVQVCPIGILTLHDDRGPALQPGMEAYCIACGHCVAVCPHGALDHARAPAAGQQALPVYPVTDPATALAFLRSRRSIRCYKDAEVPRATLEALLEAARYAPSSHNSQGVRYVVVSGRTQRERLCSIVVQWMRDIISTQPKVARMHHMAGIVRAHEAGQDLILRSAPHLIVATAERAARAAQVTTYLALEYVELYATTLGLGTCWAGYFQACAQQTRALADLLRLPEDQTITGALMAGYPKFRYHRLPERNALQVAWYSE
jgi:nitroreductase/NAD-dependent dihydropyrimidine dehydrogenase PreA subunit